MTLYPLTQGPLRFILSVPCCALRWAVTMSALCRGCLWRRSSTPWASDAMKPGYRVLVTISKHCMPTCVRRHRKTYLSVSQSQHAPAFAVTSRVPLLQPSQLCAHYMLRGAVIKRTSETVPPGTEWMTLLSRGSGVSAYSAQIPCNARKQLFGDAHVADGSLHMSQLFNTTVTRNVAMPPGPVRYVPNKNPIQPYSDPHQNTPRCQRARVRRPYILTASSAYWQNRNGMRD